MGAEALGGREARGEAILLEGAVEGGLLLELLKRVRGPAQGVCHNSLVCTWSAGVVQTRPGPRAPGKKRFGFMNHMSKTGLFSRCSSGRGTCVFR